MATRASGLASGLDKDKKALGKRERAQMRLPKPTNKKILRVRV
jgi:hypothetical protein